MTHECDQPDGRQQRKIKTQAGFLAALDQSGGSTPKALANYGINDAAWSEGQPTADYLWNVKRVVPFLKVDKGLADEKDGVPLMKPMPALAALLNKAKAKHIFGTTMRSVINQANAPESELLSTSNSRWRRRFWRRASARSSSRKWTFIVRKRPRPKHC